MLMYSSVLKILHKQHDVRCTLNQDGFYTAVLIIISLIITN